MQRVAHHRVVGEDRDADALGDQRLAHLGAVGAVRRRWDVGAEGPVHVAVHDVAGAHHHEALPAQLLEAGAQVRVDRGQLRGPGDDGSKAGRAVAGAHRRGPARPR